MTDNPKEYPYPIGPLAESFPPLSPARHAALVVRIAQHSFRPAVIVWREEIIFGVALLKAYKEAGVEPRFEQLADDADPTEALAAAAIPFLEMDNNARGRAAWMASEWSTRGRPRDEDQNSANLQNKTRAAMAERFGVSVRAHQLFRPGPVREQQGRAGVAAGGEGVEDQGDGRRPGDIPPGRGAGEGGGAGDEQGSPDRQPGGGAG